MKPPPPRLPALECVTASAKPTATAASMALPPDSSTFTPAWVAWVSRDTGEMIRLETNLMEPIGLLQLHSNAIVVDYGPVQFHTADVKLWLPQSAQAYSVYDLYKLVKHHTYSDFKLFSVGSSFVADKPKGAKDAKDAPAQNAVPPTAAKPQ